MLGSLKWSSGAASTIGTEEVTLAEYGHLIRTNPKWGPHDTHIWMKDIIDGETYCGVCGMVFSQRETENEDE
jgi:hypothetical protein